MGRDRDDAQLHRRRVHFLLPALSARRSGSGLLSGHHPVPDLLVPGSASRQDGGAVHDRHRHLERDRVTDLSRDYAVYGRRQWLARVAVVVPAGRHPLRDRRSAGAGIA